MKWLLFSLFACFDLAIADPEELFLCSIEDNFLFVRLGSYCETADILRACGYRKAAFPFDWMLSSDGKN